MIKLIKRPRPLRLKSSSLDLEKIKTLTNLNNEEAKKIVEIFEDVFSKMKKDDRLKDKYPKSIFYTIEDKIYFDLDSKYEWTWVRWSNFWEKFETEFGLNYKQIKELIYTMLKQHLKCKVFPTACIRNFLPERLEQHLKYKLFPTDIEYN